MSDPYLAISVKPRDTRIYHITAVGEPEFRRQLDLLIDGVSDRNPVVESLSHALAFNNVGRSVLYSVVVAVSFDRQEPT